MKARPAQDGDPTIAAPSGATFQIKDTESYLPVVTLSKKISQNF